MGTNSDGVAGLILITYEVKARQSEMSRRYIHCVRTRNN